MKVAFGASVPKRPIVHWICLGAILVLAVLFRFGPICSGLPYSDYVDEGHVLHQTIDAFNGKSLDVSWYGLPALPAYSIGVALFLYGPFYRHSHGHSFQDDFPNDPTLPSSRFNYDLITPVELIVAGRIVTACLSVATVFLAGIIAARLANDRTSLIAMLLVAICPALVTRGSIVIVDTFAAFFVLMTICFCLRAREFDTGDGDGCSHGPARHAEAARRRVRPASDRTSRNILFAGITTGFVFASKYPVASVGVIVLTTILTLPFSWRRRLQLMILAGLGILFGILLGAPMTYLKATTVWRDVLENYRAYGRIYSPQGYFAQAISMSEVGVPLLSAGVAGIILMLWKARTRRVAVSWILFAIVLIVLFANSSFRPFRSFLSIIPLLCIASAMVFTHLIDWAREKTESLWRLGTIILLFAACVGSVGFSSFQQETSRMKHRDTRLQAVDWLREHTEKDENILVIRELGILPGEWGRVPAQVTTLPWREALETVQKKRFDYIVTGRFDLHLAPNLKELSDYRDAWEAGIAALATQADFGQVETQVVSAVWHTNDEYIVILGGKAQ